jgi:uncharacterized membrane protein YdbT with pleckstrin-like domain
MSQDKKLFPAQEASEKVLQVIRKHWFTYVVFWIIATVMIIPLVVLAIYWFGNPDQISEGMGNLIIIAASIYGLFICGLLIYGFTDFYLDVYIITDHRIVDITQNGFFKRKISELNLLKIEDINAEVNGFWATLLHFGDVHIQTAGEHPNFVFEAIPHPYEISKKILDLHEVYLQRKECETESSIEKEIESVVTNQSVFEKRMADESSRDYPEEASEEILRGIDSTKEAVNTQKKEKEEGELREGEEIDLH